MDAVEEIVIDPWAEMLERILCKSVEGGYVEYSGDSGH